MQSESNFSSGTGTFSADAASVLAEAFSTSIWSTSAAVDAAPVPVPPWGTPAESSATSAELGTNSVWLTNPGSC